MSPNEKDDYEARVEALRLALGHFASADPETKVRIALIFEAYLLGKRENVQ